MIFIRVTALELSMQSQCLLYDFFSFRCVCVWIDSEKKNVFLLFKESHGATNTTTSSPQIMALQKLVLLARPANIFFFCLSLCRSSPIECERQRTQRSNCLLCLSVFLTFCSLTTFYKREKKKSFHTIEFLFNQRP